eukprot:scaffold9819_cov21-Tisochrysis_lutea.AAC.6
MQQKTAVDFHAAIRQQSFPAAVPTIHASRQGDHMQQNSCGSLGVDGFTNLGTQRSLSRPI